MPGSENSIAIMFHYVYTLQSMKNNNLYVGYTDDLRKRLQEHNRGLNFSTKPHRLRNIFMKRKINRISTTWYVNNY